MTDLHYLELTELAARIETRQLSAMTAARAQLDRIACLDGELGSYALVMADVAMAQAKEETRKLVRAGITGRFTAFRSR